jgi:hypothetical protein
MKTFFNYLLCACLLAAGCTEIIYLPAEEYEEKYGKEQTEEGNMTGNDESSEAANSGNDMESGNGNDSSNESGSDNGPVEFQGSGTKSDPYLISSLSHLKKLCSDVSSGMMYKNEYFLQTVDIVINKNLRNAEGELLKDNPVSWFGIGQSKYEFCGHYDGGNNSISGLYNDGLFDYIKDGSVSNLIIIDSYINAGMTSRGILCSFLENSKVSNCHIKSSTALCDGGIVGIMTNGVVENSSFEGLITGSCAGAIIDSGTGKVMNCANLGVFKDYEGDYPYYIGGIARRCDKGLSIVNCLNAGEINVSGRTVGGIVGQAFKIYADNSFIANNLNYAKISTRLAGGVVGEINGASKTWLTIEFNYYIETFSHDYIYLYNDASWTALDNTCMSAKEIKSEEFVAKLNRNAAYLLGGNASKWKIGKSGFPVLEWMD